MKKYLCFLLIGLGCYSCNPNEFQELRVQNTELEYNSNTNTWFQDGKPFDGVVYHEFRNGNLRQEIVCVNGQGNGPVAWYAWDGDLVFEGAMKGGKLEGGGRHYHDNGNLQSIEYYKNDELHGTIEYYDEDGKLSYTMEYKKGGKIKDSYSNKKSR